MTPLHPTNLIAFSVPEDAENFEIDIVNTNKWLRYSMPYGKSNEIILEECNLKILGTATKDTIDFDVEPWVIKHTTVDISGIKEIKL